MKKVKNPSEFKFIIIFIPNRGPSKQEVVVFRSLNYAFDKNDKDIFNFLKGKN